MRMDLTNQRFGRLLAIKLSERENNKRSYWVCKCDCGNLKEVGISHLRSGATTSCGCYQKQKASESNHKHGGRGTSLYNRWKQMRHRCENPEHVSYRNYGARGIKVADEWKDYSVFKEWSELNGYRESLTIDRTDNNKGYSPQNCRWVDHKTNSRNRRNTIRLEGLTLAEIAEDKKVDYNLIRRRYYHLISKGVKPSINKLINY